MKKTKEIKRELEEKQGLDYLEQYYHELLDDSVPREVKEDIINKTLGI